MGDDKGGKIEPAEARFRVKPMPGSAKLLERKEMERKEMCPMALGL